MSNEVSEHVEHSSPPQIIAFLFCRDVLVESDGSISPFRLVEGVNITVPKESDPVMTVWQNVEFCIFVGVSCYGSQRDHPHKLSVTMTAPSGERRLYPMEADILPPLYKAYARIKFNLPGSLAGRYKFEIDNEGVPSGIAFFTVTHTLAGADANS